MIRSEVEMSERVCKELGEWGVRAVSQVPLWAETKLGRRSGNRLDLV